MHNNLEIISFEEYIKKIKNASNYNRELEIFVISKVFNISIYVFEINNNKITYRFLYKYENESLFINHCCLVNHKIL